MKYDVENLLTDIESFLKSDLNTKLAAIDTEKNDSITLDQISTSRGYACQMLDDVVMNEKAFVFYGIEDVETKGLGGVTAGVYTISVLALLSDDGNDANILKRLLRYQRALKEVVEENCAKLPPGRISISSGIPADFKALSNPNTYRVIGIFLQIDLS